MNEVIKTKGTKPAPIKKRRKTALDAFPGITIWWNYEKNEGMNPAEISVGSKKKFFFTCPNCGEEIHREMYRFLIHGKDGSYQPMTCQKCKPTKSSLRVSLIEAVPDIEKYWDYEKNVGKKPSDFSKSASDKVWTFCPICGTSVCRSIRYTWEPDEEGVGRVIHCRTCGKRNDGNSLTKLFPEVTKYWDYEKNDHKPEYYSVSSGKKAYFICPECGKDRLVAICDAVVKEDGGYRVTICNDCSIKKGNHEARTMSEICPDIMDYWDEKNDIEPGKVPISSLKMIFTRCPSCGKLLHRRAVNTLKRDGERGTFQVNKCQRCATTETAKEKALKRSGPAIKECQELEEWWDFEKNVVDLFGITKGSKENVWLKCPACGHERATSLHGVLKVSQDGILRPVACPECGYSSKGDPEDNLVNLCPEIKEWWDYDENAPFRPEQFTKGSQFRAHMNCPDCGMHLYTGIHSLVHTNGEGRVVISHKGRCRKFKAMESDNNLVKRYPEVKEWWDYEENYPNLPNEFTTQSPLFAYFKCPKCGTGRKRRISDAFSLAEDGTPTLFRCTFCEGKKPISDSNSLEALFPDLAKECIGSDPKQIFPNSSSRTMWKCSKCNETWFDLVVNRVKGAGCPYCEGRRVLPGVNSFFAKYPDLVKEEWADIENMLIGVDPDQILDNYSGDVWWECPICKKLYTMSVKKRLLKKKRGHNPCKFCNGGRWLKEYIIY